MRPTIILSLLPDPGSYRYKELVYKYIVDAGTYLVREFYYLQRLCLVLVNNTEESVHEAHHT